MRLLVCGSREWTDRNAIARELISLAPDVVIHGDARGADIVAGTVAYQWAIDERRTLRIEPYPADWTRDGKAAGPIRNARMLAEGKPDRGLAFGALWKPSGLTPRRTMTLDPDAWKRTGTGDMVAKMLRVGLPVRWVASPGAVAVDLVAMPVPS